MTSKEDLGYKLHVPTYLPCEVHLDKEGMDDATFLSVYGKTKAEVPPCSQHEEKPVDEYERTYGSNPFAVTQEPDKLPYVIDDPNIKSTTGSVFNLNGTNILNKMCPVHIKDYCIIPLGTMERVSAKVAPQNPDLQSNRRLGALSAVKEHIESAIRSARQRLVRDTKIDERQKLIKNYLEGQSDTVVYGSDPLPAQNNEIIRAMTADDITSKY